jgi:hypothetical protein
VCQTDVDVQRSLEHIIRAHLFSAASLAKAAGSGLGPSVLRCSRMICSASSGDRVMLACRKQGHRNTNVQQLIRKTRRFSHASPACDCWASCSLRA